MSYRGFYGTYTEEQEREFQRLFTGARGYIFSAIKKYHYFIEEWEEMDYFQEISMELWRRYHQFNKYKSPFKAWAFLIAESAIFKYRRYLKKDIRRTSYFEDMSLWYGIADEMYDESRVAQLMNAVHDLPAEDRDIALLYLSGEEIEKLSVKIGKAPGYITKRMMRVHTKIRDQRHLYFDYVDLNEQALAKRYKPTGKTGALHVQAKAVHMLTVEGKFIKRYGSISETAKDGFNPKNIQAVLRGKMYIEKGYRWIYEGESRPEVLNRKPTDRRASQGSRCKPIAQVDIFGKLVKVWPSMSSTKLGGFQTSNIHKVMKGKCKTCRGYVFRYATAEDLAAMPPSV